MKTMRASLNFIILAAVLGALTTAQPTPKRSSDDIEKAFQKFVKEFGKSYASSMEREARMEIFAANLAFIEAENAREGRAYTLGVNEFSDLNFEEFKRDRMGYKKQQEGALLALGTEELRAPAGFQAPDSVDWVAKGAVTSVKNQAQCGSCWAFSTAGVLEGALVAVKGGKLQDLSPEFLVDCDNKTDSGCGGGLPIRAYDYVKRNGLCLDSAYPYVAGGGTAGTCHACTELGVQPGQVSGGQTIPADTNSLLAAVTKQPVSIAIEADKQVFQHYQSGVLQGSSCGTQLDHAVLLVGFGSDTTNGTTPYWKVKNSWGATWGEQGYIRMERGVPGAGECGLLQAATVPTFSSQLEETASLVV